MSTRPVEDWFHNAVLSGVQRLYALNLPDRPAAEVVQLTAVTWVDVLWALLPWAEHLGDCRWRSPAWRLRQTAGRRRCGCARICRPG
jgi:hypothetical protein